MKEWKPQTWLCGKMFRKRQLVDVTSLATLAQGPDSSILLKMHAIYKNYQLHVPRCYKIPAKLNWPIPLDLFYKYFLGSNDEGGFFCSPWTLSIHVKK